MIIALPQAGDLADYTDLTDVALRKKLETERGLFMAESATVISRAVAAGYRPRSFLMAERWLESMRETITRATGHADGGEVPVYIGTDEELRRLTGFHVHRGALAAMHRRDLPSLAETLAGARRVAILEDIVDHTNVGAAFRSAAALGVDAIVCTPSCADPLYRRAVRVSMGTVFQVPFTRISPWPQGIEHLRALGFRVAALALADNALTIDELAARNDDKLAVVLGTEGDGLTRRTIAACDDIVTIPMAHGVDSLNVAAAAAVAFYALRAR